MVFGIVCMVVMMLVLAVGSIEAVGSTYEVSPLEAVGGISDQPTNLNLPTLDVLVPGYSPWAEDIKRKKSKACAQRRQLRKRTRGYA